MIIAAPTVTVTRAGGTVGVRTTYRFSGHQITRRGGQAGHADRVASQEESVQMEVAARRALREPQATTSGRVSYGLTTTVEISRLDGSLWTARYASEGEMPASVARLVNTLIALAEPQVEGGERHL